MLTEDNAKAVDRMQSFIENALDHKITMLDLARAAGYSPYHAARIFKELTGKSPFEYIRAMRLTEAAKKLRGGDVKVVDTAMDFLFSSHEGFTRSFTKEFGISPRKYMDNPIPLQYFIPYSALSYYLYLNRKGESQVMETKNNIVFVQVMDREARKAIVKRGVCAEEYFAYCSEVGCDVWGVLESVKDALFEPAGYWLPDKLIKPGTSRYIQGVEVSADYKGKVPEGYDIIDLAPQKFLVFQGQPFKDEEFEDAVLSVQAAIEKYDPTPYGYEFDYDSAPSFQLAPLGYRGYLEARPIRILKNK
jgi:AraC-like DNA-binding protein